MTRVAAPIAETLTTLIGTVPLPQRLVAAQRTAYSWQRSDAELRTNANIPTFLLMELSRFPTRSTPETRINRGNPLSQDYELGPGHGLVEESDRRTDQRRYPPRPVRGSHRIERTGRPGPALGRTVSEHLARDSTRLGRSLREPSSSAGATDGGGYQSVTAGRRRVSCVPVEGGANERSAAHSVRVARFLVAPE